MVTGTVNWGSHGTSSQRTQTMATRCGARGFPVEALCVYLRFNISLQGHHAKDEILSTNVYEEIPVSWVLATCSVLDMTKYIAYINYRCRLLGTSPILGPLKACDNFSVLSDLTGCKVVRDHLRSKARGQSTMPDVMRTLACSSSQGVDNPHHTETKPRIYMSVICVQYSHIVCCLDVCCADLTVPAGWNNRIFLCRDSNAGGHYDVLFKHWKGSIVEIFCACVPLYS